MANTSYSDYNKIANDFKVAEGAFNLSSKQIETKLREFLNSQEVMTNGYSGLPDTLKRDFSIHILRLKEYADAYYVYHEHNPLVERAIALQTVDVAAKAQVFGLDEDAEKILTFTNKFVIQKFTDVYNKFRANQCFETLTAIFVVLEDMQSLGISHTSQIRSNLSELDKMDLSQYIKIPNFSFSDIH